MARSGQSLNPSKSVETIRGYITSNLRTRATPISHVARAAEPLGNDSPTPGMLQQGDVALLRCTAIMNLVDPS